MTKLTMTATQIATLKGARANTATQSAVKKAIFSALRSAAAIPASIKLKVEIDNLSDRDYGVVKDKSSGYALLVNSYGRYTGLDAPVRAAAASTSQQGSVTVSNPAGTGTAVVRRISRASLLALLRTYGSASVAHTGAHPVLPNVDSVGLDNNNGDVYFRTR